MQSDPALHSAVETIVHQTVCTSKRHRLVMKGERTSKRRRLDMTGKPSQLRPPSPPQAVLSHMFPAVRALVERLTSHCLQRASRFGCQENQISAQNKDKDWDVQLVFFNELIDVEMLTTINVSDQLMTNKSTFSIAVQTVSSTV